MTEALRRDPDFLIQGAFLWFRDTGNPYYAWCALQFCIEHQKAFPEWLLTYLAGCAERMMSDEASNEGRDLRKALPGIFGFPNVFEPTQRKHGPGNLLDPYSIEPDTTSFALQFATRLEKGETPSAAMRNACDVLKGKDADADEKTLRRWLLKEFDLKEWPSNADAWKATANITVRTLNSFRITGTKSRETLSRSKSATVVSLIIESNT